MIVLDTNVVSEPTKPHPNPAPVAWLNRQPIEACFLTAVSLGGEPTCMAGLHNDLARVQLAESGEELLSDPFAQEEFRRELDKHGSHGATLPSGHSGTLLKGMPLTRTDVADEA